MLEKLVPDESGTAPDSIGVRMRPPDHPERVALERAAAASAGPPICARLSAWNSRPQRARAWRHGDHVPRCAQGNALGRGRRRQFLDCAALSTRPPGSQILVKRTASGDWEVDLDLGLDYLRTASMASIR